MESTGFLAALERLGKQFFSLSWKRLHNPQNLKCNALSNSGLYALALVHHKGKIGIRDIVYIGMTTSRERHLRKRLTEFRDGIETNGKHSAAITFYKRHNKPFSELEHAGTFYFIALPITLWHLLSWFPARPRRLRYWFIKSLESFLIAYVFDKTGKAPTLNVA
jgi:hypothetical protein